MNGAFELFPNDGLDLTRLAEQLSSIASQLRGGFPADPSGSARETNPYLVGGSAIEGPDKRESRRDYYAEQARKLYATRRQRESIFGDAELFGEPAWDILLDLYIAFADEKKVSVSSACIGSATPSTTGLRWLGILAEQGLVTREHDPDDQRRVLVRLSDEGLAAMDTYFASAASRD